jgi:hypothetical protein
MSRLASSAASFQQAFRCRPYPALGFFRWPVAQHWHSQCCSNTGTLGLAGQDYQKVDRLKTLIYEWNAMHHLFTNSLNWYKAQSVNVGVAWIHRPVERRGGGQGGAMG